MQQRNHAYEPASATESKFYLPGTVSPSAEAGPLERLLTTLFGHKVGTTT